MTISIPLTEPSHFRYIHINPATNRVHLLVPFIAGIEVSTDNTCKADVELRVFFEGGAVNELSLYKSTLEFHLSLLAENNPHYPIKKARLEQVELYIAAVIDMRNSYKTVVNSFLSRPSNLYSIQLRPTIQDSASRVINPVFTINRVNDIFGTPLSVLYNKMHEIFPALELGKANPRTALIVNTLAKLAPDAGFDAIKHTLKSQCTEQFQLDIDVENWIKPIKGGQGIKEPVNQVNVDLLMGFDGDGSCEDYINALLGICAPNLWQMLPGSPFYNGIYNNKGHQAESLSMMLQFYLGILNVYCHAQGISDKNFGVILDGSSPLSQELVEIVAAALSHGEAVESAIIAFFNQHHQDFQLTRKLNTQDNDALVQKFESTYRTVTATKENPHMDDFMFLDTEAQGEQDVFLTHNGLICTDAANIIPPTPQNEVYLAETRREAGLHHDIIKPQDEPVITLDIELDELRDKLSDVQWESLPEEVMKACRALPEFKHRELLDDVAKGRQNEAQAIFTSSEDQQTRLRTPGKFIDYSGRAFYCTAYEYAYWAKDRHMMRMLEAHMDDETRALMLEKINAMEQVGLSYQQHGIAYQNAHYDMSFILKELSLAELNHLKAIIGQNSARLNTVTVENYQQISFTADEYEQLKQQLARQKVSSFILPGFACFRLSCYLVYPFFFIASFFITSPAEKLSKKLKFDFHSLITALDTYVTHYDKWNYNQQEEAWLKIGQAQRDVPAHVAHEYCRPDRSFDPLPAFTEDTLPRSLTFHNNATNVNSWFSRKPSDLGFDFTLIRASIATHSTAWRNGAGWMAHDAATYAQIDLAAVRHLDVVRIADLRQSHENLNQPASQLGLGY